MWFLKTDVSEKWCWQGVFSPEDCAKIIKLCDALGTNKGVLDKGRLDETVRKSETLFLPINEETKWIFERCADGVNFVNEKYFNMDLISIYELQYSVYEEGGFYKKHIDTLYSSFGIRKLSFSVQLSDPDGYEGGDLLLHYGDNPDVAKRDLGMGTFFNSLTLHEVKPVTKGKRIALVGWVIGPKLK